MSELTELIIELLLLVCLITLTFTKADIRFVIEAATIYLASVIRHNGRYKND